MKKSKKLAVILLTLLMLLSLSACSMADMPVLKAALNFARLNSAHVVPEGELGLKINVPAYGMNMDILFTADGDLDYCADPLQLAGELRIQAMDETIEVLVYGEDRGGDFILDYSVDGAPWEAAEATVALPRFVNDAEAVADQFLQAQVRLLFGDDE